MITSSLIPFCPPNPSIYSCFLFSKLWLHFLLNCVNMSYALLSTTCSVCIMLFVCVFSGMTIWYWITYWCVLSVRSLFLSLLVFFNCLYFFFKRSIEIQIVEKAIIGNSGYRNVGSWSTPLRISLVWFSSSLLIICMC